MHDMPRGRGGRGPRARPGLRAPVPRRLPERVGRKLQGRATTHMPPLEKQVSEQGENCEEALPGDFSRQGTEGGMAGKIGKRAGKVREHVEIVQ